MQDAMRVCAHLQIPFQMIDLSDNYFNEVISYLINEYRIGRTPNPDVMCNSSIKFGAFYAWAMTQGADFVATGHYARVQPDGTLCKAIDPAKDQSYFLWNVPKERLAKTLFPVGNYQKADVRKLAERFGLPTATKPDSQGLCFIGDVDLKSFLENQLRTSPGNVLSISGEVIGTHKGAVLYTNGERHGFTIQTNNTGMLPHYVVGRDIEKNTITVSANPAEDDKCGHIVLAQTNFFMNDIPTAVEAVLRYHSAPIPASCTQTKSGCQLELNTTVPGVTVGQSAVLYVGDVCVGGGIIDQA
jgi:tRNA-specific 2-thiouridylase